MSATGGSWAWTDDAGVVHSLDRPNLRARELTNVYSVPPLRGEDVVVASYPGEVWMEKQHGARRLDIELLIFDPAQSGAVYPIITELAGAFGIHQQGTLTHHRPDGSVVAAQAQVNSWTSPRSDLGPFTPVQQGPMGIWYLAKVPFNLADPYFYGPQISLGPTDLSSGSAAQMLVHPGNVRGWKVVVTITGPATNPQIANAANGFTLQALTALGSGHTLVIDGGAWTALVDGTTNVIGTIVHAGGFPFLFVEPGANALTTTATGAGAGATVTTSFQPPWL